MGLEDLKARMAGGEPGEPKLPLVKAEVVTVTAAELREAVEACHCKDVCPCCRTYLKAIRGLPDNYKLHVDKVDLQAVLEGRTVIVETTIQDGREVRTKRLGPPHDTKPSPKKEPAAKK